MAAIEAVIWASVRCASTRFGLFSVLPVVNVVAFVLILVSTIPVYLAQRISSGVRSGGRI